MVRKALEKERAAGQTIAIMPMTTHSTKPSERKITSSYLNSIPIALEISTPTCGFPQFLEKFLVEYKSHSTDLLHFGFCCCISVNKICCNGNGQLATKFLPAKSWKERNFQRRPRLSREEGRSPQTGTGVDEDIGEHSGWESMGKF